MKLNPLLLAVPLSLGLMACGSPPEIEAANREEAFKICLDEVDEAMNKIRAERSKAVANPSLADFETNPNFHSDFRWSFLLDDEFNNVEIIQGYCSPSKNTKFSGYWYVTGYIEFLKRPTSKSITVQSELDRVVASYGTAWKE